MDSASFLRGVRTFLRLVALLAEERRRSVYEPGMVRPTPLTPPPILLRGPIVPPAETRVLPADETIDAQTCDLCGAHWQPRLADLRIQSYDSSPYHLYDAGWLGRLACPACDATVRYWVARFRRCAGWAGRRGWMFDRLTGRTVRYGRQGWEERTDG